MYLAGAEMVETYPVPPLFPGFSLSVGVTSYDGAVYYGISADRDALPDIEVLGQCVREALDELVDSASDTRLRAPRGAQADQPETARESGEATTAVTCAGSTSGELTRWRGTSRSGGIGPTPVHAPRGHRMAACGLARGRRGGVGVRRPDGGRGRLSRTCSTEEDAAPGGRSSPRSTRSPRITSRPR